MDPIEQAFRRVKRANFVPEELRTHSDVDAPLPIGFGQTISQPTTVQMMLEWLEPEPGDKILDVGSGSGWTSALLAHIVGPRGKVYAVERIPELVDFGRDNVGRLGFKNVSFFVAGKQFGLTKYAPYDRILVSAAAQELPPGLVRQLRIGGKMVIPVENDVLKIEKTTKDKYQKKTHPGFIFVPLISPQ
jgi:protein-L-isoaspartate(D-aspartate) O-methyltransferase